MASPVALYLKNSVSMPGQFQLHGLYKASQNLCIALVKFEGIKNLSAPALYANQDYPKKGPIGQRGKPQQADNAGIFASTLYTKGIRTSAKAKIGLMLQYMISF